MIHNITLCVCKLNKPTCASAALLKLQSERLLRQAEEAERKAREAEEGTQQEYREEDRESSGTKTQTEKAVRIIIIKSSLEE